MSAQDSVGVYDTVEFGDNPEARCSVVLILDVSGSMQGAPIDTVNRALAKFRDIIRGDTVTALRADVAIVAFDEEAWVVQDFTNGTDFEPPVLSTYGGTNYSLAVNLAMDIIDARKQSYRDGGISYYRSLAYFLTDGIPNDQPADLAQASARLSRMEQDRNVAFCSFVVSNETGYLFDLGELAGLVGTNAQELVRVAAVGDRARDPDSPITIDLQRIAALGGMDEAGLLDLGIRRGVIRTPLSELAKLAPSNRPPVELTNMAQLDGSIEWLSRSVAAVSQSQPGDTLRLPSLDFRNM